MHAGCEGPGILCQKLTGAWFWRAEDAVTPPRSHEYPLELAGRYLPHNVNLIMNLSPNRDGRIDDNLAAEYALLGRKFSMPAPLTEAPEGWLRR